MFVQVSDTKSAGERAKAARSDSAGTAAGGKQPREERISKEKSPSQQADAHDRIRAKLIAISEQSVADVAGSQLSRSRDTKTSSRIRSPSPKRYTHVSMMCARVKLLVTHERVELNYVMEISGVLQRIALNSRGSVIKPIESRPAICGSLSSETYC